ncbi:hypothetical protein [Bacillus sp. AFS017274]|nr:hypothetical protein CN380_17645 [Bacillus sp. AFS017274]
MAADGIAGENTFSKLFG